MIERIHRALTRFFLETFCFVGIVACYAMGALLYEPPEPPPEQNNYSQSHYALGSTYRPETERH